MTGVELIMLLIGSVFMIGSFFITERLSPSELNKIAELSEDELKKIINRGLENAGSRIADTIDEQIEASSDKVERALEKETNDKIMAISEYSDTVVESMNKTHNEIMFLYSMLNDKHAELTGMVSNIQKLAADVRNLQENMPVMAAQTASVTPSQTVPPVQKAAPVQTAKRQPVSAVRTETAKPAAVPKPAVMKEEKAEPEKQAKKDNSNKEILALHKEGVKDVEIARRLGLGIGEVRLVIGLYRGE